MDRKIKSIMAPIILCAALWLFPGSLENEIADSVLNHLQFLGYTIREGDERTVALVENEADIYIEDFRGGLLFFTYYPLNRAVDRNDLLEIIDLLNSNAVISRYYLDDNYNLRIEFWFPSLYDRQVFGRIFNLWQEESRDYVFASEIGNHIIAQ